MAFQIKTVFVALADREGEPLVKFYRCFLGLDPTVLRPHIYAEFSLPGLRLGIFQPHPDQVSEFTGSQFASSAGSISLCLEVEQLEAAIAHLHAIGSPPPGAIKTASHGREIYAYDPAGNRLILHEACPV